MIERDILAALSLGFTNFNKNCDSDSIEKGFSG